MNKKLKLLYIVAGMGICLVPLIFMGVNSDTVKEKENTIPSITNDDGFNENYFQEMGNWFINNCGLRTEMVSLNSRIMADVFGVSSVDNITVGKNGWLYASATEESYKGNAEYSERVTNSIAHNVKVIEKALKKRGIDFIFTIPPNKNTLYPENMPYYAMKVKDSKNLENIKKAMDKEGISYADLYSAFKEKDETLYLSMDSHWNGKGAVLAYNEIMTKTDIPHNSYKGKEPVDTDYTGDLSSTAFPVFSKSEENPVYQTYAETDVDVEKNSITTYCPAGTGNLLMYRDSFGNTLLPLMSGEFSKAHYEKADSDYFTDYKIQNDIMAYSPDVVVIEIVERHLLDFIYYAPEIESAVVKNPEKIKNEKTSTTCNIKVKDNLYSISGICDSKNLSDESEFYVMLTDENGKSKTYSAFNMSFVKNGNQNDYGFKAYITSDSMPEGKIDVKILLKNKNNINTVAEKKENIKKKYPLKSEFGVKNSEEVSGKAVVAFDYEYKSVNSKDKGYVYLYNCTDSDIKKIEVRESNTKKWSKNILKKNIKKGSKVNVNLPVSDNETIVCDVRITYKDNITHTLSDIAFYDILSLNLQREKNYSYIEYLSVNNYKDISTKDREESLYQTRLAKEIARKKRIAEAKRRAEEKKRLEEEASRAVEASIAAQQEAERLAYEAQLAAQQQAQQQAQQAQQEATQAPVEETVGGDGCLSGIVLRDNAE